MDHPIQCRCGLVHGQLSRQARVTRCMCYCKNCQAFARFLGRSKEILDESGGTDILQTLPVWIQFDQGVEHIACVRLSDKGIFRWYANCCKTPIGNTVATAKFSFIGLIHNCLETEDQNLNEHFGPVSVVVNSESAIGPSRPREKGKLGGLCSVLSRALLARMNGQYRHTPFFHIETNSPIVTPRILSKEESRKYRSQRYD